MELVGRNRKQSYSVWSHSSKVASTSDTLRFPHHYGDENSTTIITLPLRQGHAITLIMAYRGQPLPPDHELWEACETGNIDRMRELFQTDNITANEAHWCLEELVSENVIGVDVVSCLLEHGADAKEFNFFCLKPCQSLEIFQLLAAHGLEFKEFGHLFLESV